jgi:cation transport protein ChaC
VPDTELVEILRTANGRYGSTLAYLVETERSLRTCGIRDRDVERMVALARRHALTA